MNSVSEQWLRARKEAVDAAVRAGDIATAIAGTRSILLTVTDDPIVLFTVAKLQERLGENGPAANAYWRAALVWGGSGSAPFHAGAALARLGDYHHAVDALALASRVMQENNQLDMMLAASLWKIGKKSDALAIVTKLARRADLENDVITKEKICLFIFHNVPGFYIVALVPDAVTVISRLDYASSITLRYIDQPTWIEGLARQFLQRVALNESKSVFYPLSYLFSHLRDRYPEVAERLLEFWMSMVPERHRDVSMSHGQRTMEGVARSSEGSIWGPVVDAWLHDDKPRFLEAAKRAIGSGEEPPDAFETVIAEGFGKGHAAWHLLSPFFSCWLRSPATDSDVQDGWLKNRAITAGGTSLTPEAYWEWMRSDPVLKRHVVDFARRCGEKSTILDIGCGNGFWLRLLADLARIEPSGLFGTDLHENRVENARTMLMDWQRSRGFNGVVDWEENLFAANILEDHELFLERFKDKIDVVTLFFVTGCFEDELYRRFIGKVLACRPRYVLHATVADRWDFYRGREDDPRYFAECGYDHCRSVWCPSPLSKESAATLLHPQQYWSNKRLDVFRLSSAE